MDWVAAVKNEMKAALWPKVASCMGSVLLVAHIYSIGTAAPVMTLAKAFTWEGACPASPDVNLTAAAATVVATSATSPTGNVANSTGMITVVQKLCALDNPMAKAAFLIPGAMITITAYCWAFGGVYFKSVWRSMREIGVYLLAAALPIGAVNSVLLAAIGAEEVIRWNLDFVVMVACTWAGMITIAYRTIIVDGNCAEAKARWEKKVEAAADAGAPPPRRKSVWKLTAKASLPGAITLVTIFGYAFGIFPLHKSME